MEYAIRKQQAQKAGGPDSTTAECFHHLPQHMKDKLRALINASILLEVTPAQWQDNFVKLIHKKKETTKISNYRPISLLNTIFKIWERVLYSKLKQQINIRLVTSKAQFGSQQGKGATDAILANNIIQEGTDQDSFYSATVDLSKAYNRIDRSKLWVKLNELGVSCALIAIIKSTYSNHNEIYKIGGDTTPPLKLKRGLRQGSVLSPILFTAY